MRAPRRLWTKEEDASLVDAVELHGSRSWDKIADLLPGRTASQCNARFLHYLHPNVSHKPFSPAEDMCILSSYMLIGAQWATIALDLPGRTNHAIKNRWQSLRTRVLKEAHVGATPSAAGCQPSREHAPPFERGRVPTPLLPSSSADELCLTGAAMSADDTSDDTDGSKTTDNAGAQAYRHRRDSDASSPSVGATSSAGELDESLLAFDFFDADLDLFDALFADLNGTGRG